MTLLAFISFAGLTTNQSILLVLALVFGFYMAWNIGANDVANAMGTSVGSGALTLKWAIILAAIFEFGGAYLVGSNVSETVRKGIFDPALIADPNILAAGMIASLLAAGMWLQVASYFGWPVSTTHSIVGAVVVLRLLVGEKTQSQSVTLAWMLVVFLWSAVRALAWGFDE